MNRLHMPLTFKPLYKAYLWGGQRIASLYGRPETPAVCAESWEVAAHPAGTSVVSAGPFAGARLDDLAAREGAALVGTRAPIPGRFPLLFKLIDAQDRLSVQVHPNETSAAITGGDPKTEMWYVLHSTPDASLYAGLKEGTTPEMLAHALDRHGVEPLLERLTVRPGQALFIPGGLVHAIGAGCLIYEVQQNSNTTYRLYDWDRLDAQGAPRPLHLDESLRALDWNLPVPKMQIPQPVETRHGNVLEAVISCDFFNVRRLHLKAPFRHSLDGTTFVVLFVAAGRITVCSGGASLSLGAGASVLIPASAPEYALTPEVPSTLLLTTL